MKRLLIAVAFATLAIALLVSGAAVAGTSTGSANSGSNGNPFGISVVRFSKGTSLASMTGAVQSAGGTVVTDLSEIGAVAADPGSQGASAFIGRVSKAKGVKAAWQDRVIRSVLPDGTSESATVNNDPQLGSPGPSGPPDPWHNLPSFLGETNPEGILQWDDNRMDVPSAWPTTLGQGVKVAVIDSGVQGSHKEILPNYDNQDSTNTIPCNELEKVFGPGVGQKDCSSEDTYGHGTWVASRIVGAANGFASNGVAPSTRVMGIKALSTTLGGGLTSWIVDGMIHACDAGANIINMSLGGYDDLSAAGQQDYLMWVDATNYCNTKGTAIFASAGNEHVLVKRVNLTIGGQQLKGVGQVDTGNQGIETIIPGGTVAANSGPGSTSPHRAGRESSTSRGTT